MKTTILAGAAALALAFAPNAMAQDADMPTMSAEQQSMYDAWPPDRRAMYDAWDDDVQVYYWTLTPPQQTGWWALDDTQRARVFAMTPEQRAAAWRSISAQMAGATPAAATSMNSGSARINYVSNEVIQNIPIDQATGEVPVCDAGQTDNCINAWEAGRRGGGVDQPLGYWPGPD